MSRHTERATVYLVADDVDQALEDLETDWFRDGSQRRLTETTTRGQERRALPVDRPAHIARLRAELDDLDRFAPPNPTAALKDTHFRLGRLKGDRQSLEWGWAKTPEGEVACDYIQTRSDREQAEHRSHNHVFGIVERRRSARTARQLAKQESHLGDQWDRTVQPALDRLDHQIADVESDVAGLQADDRFYRQWRAEHPDYGKRMEALERQLLRYEDPDRAQILDRLDGAMGVCGPAEPRLPELGL
jgi:hypothetical protein